MSRLALVGPGFSIKSQKFLAALLTICLALLAARFGVAQQSDTNQSDDYASRTRAVDEANSRAEKEAEQLVSLPPEKIILLLQQEPGLFLEVKKLLVRKAFAQGRVLDPKELTDEAIFDLIQSDQETRALITQQIVDRGYVHAKPTREELAKEYEEQQQLESENQRRQYATAYNEQLGTTSPQPSRTPYSGTQRPNQPLYGPPAQQNGQPSAPSNQINSDQRRQLLQASLQNSGSQDSDGLPLDSIMAGQQQLTPEQMQQLSSHLPQGFSSADLGKLASAVGGNGAASTSQPPAQSQEDAYFHPSPSSAQQRSPETVASLDQNSPFSTTTPPPIYRERPPEQPRLLHRSNPYADVPSLYDLYSQYSRQPAQLQRFGMDIFENGTGNFDQLPMDLPAGPDYVLGPGDGVNIDLWGSVSQRLHRAVDREGRLSLPEIGSLQVAGHTLGDVQQMIQTALRTQFRELEADVSLDRVRAVRVYVVGDVQRPGAYDVSSLSTPLNALYQAGGPTSRGSMRIVKHYRGNQLIETVDLYDLLLRGVQSGMQRLESGDTILVPPVGQQVTIEGMVRRPAVYELAGEKNLSDVLQLAGGVLPSGTLRHVDVERVEAHQDRTMLRVDLPVTNDSASVNTTFDQFLVQDGDKVRISPILPYADKTVYLDGHVFRPGKYAYRDGMKITDLIHSYSDLLPEPYNQHAEVIRLNGPDLQPQIIAFNLQDALQGKGQDLALMGSTGRSTGPHLHFEVLKNGAQVDPLRFIGEDR